MEFKQPSQETAQEATLKNSLVADLLNLFFDGIQLALELEHFVKKVFADAAETANSMINFFRPSANTFRSIHPY